MNKLLVICGPTATGKTALGLHLAKRFKGEIISADSRQVYKDMNIGTGKEWGEGVKIHGYDLANPKEEFSVSQFLKFAANKISEIKQKGKLPIVVGGTGFYIKGLIDGIPTVDVPRNNALRGRLEKIPASELLESLSQIDALKAASLNSSDRKNPRRLIRAIEVAQYLLDHPINSALVPIRKLTDVLMIGLTSDKESLFKNIEKRVQQRVDQGMKQEIKTLLDSGISWHDQAMYSLGYRQYRDYFEGGVDEEHVISEWKKEERKYAMRQMVWFKKDQRINWYDFADPDLIKKVEEVVEKWDNKHNG